jgi:predicted transcriptional regulator
MKYSPRLVSKDIRLSNSSRLPEELKKAIQRIARKEKTSCSWVIEQIILEWAGLDIEYREGASRLK